MNADLLKPLTALPKIGESLAKYLAKIISGNRIFDLLLHLPSRIEPIKLLPNFSEINHEELVIIRGRIEAHQQPSNHKQPFKVICYNLEGYFTLIFFKVFPSQLIKLAIGNEIVVLGFFENKFGENQITHPIAIFDANELEKFPKFYATYPLGAKINNRLISNKINQALSYLKKFETEWIDLNLIKNQGWPSFNKALHILHLPQNSAEIANQDLARKRLAFDELLAWQIAMIFAKNSSKKLDFTDQTKIEAETIAVKPIQKFQFLADEFIKNLPFTPTKAQLKAIAKIGEEIVSSKKMLRLLQGDVGSGKTIVAIFACLKAIELGAQTAVIAPTAVLAKQHFSYFSKFLSQTGLRLALLTSSTSKKTRQTLLDKLVAGEIDILVGTHAILEADVIFKNFGLAVIDEQHRFGVMQRIRLVEKGRVTIQHHQNHEGLNSKHLHDQKHAKNVARNIDLIYSHQRNKTDTLLMSATPIPRSLMMGLYGDIDISILDEKPKNRLEITTSILSQKKSSELFESLKKIITRDEKIFWICPAIDENPESSLVSTSERFAELQQVFGEETVVLLHGKMKEGDKEKVMQNFASENSKAKLMVATTVIEVGIDIPSATVMVIENAENFGLAQLHQLRGRVGRSDKKSFCILLYGERFGANGRKRLEILKTSNDGFFIAEEDLKLRGSGELVGTKQSGFPEFRVADLGQDYELMMIANKQAKIVLNDDENLLKVQNEKYRFLLKLFGYEDCLKMIEGG